ncbi:MAG: hypothetical protein ACLP01_17265 [Solirubrobacteraceae bacterium]
MATTRGFDTSHGWLLSGEATLKDPHTQDDITGFLWILVLVARDLPPVPIDRLPFVDEAFSGWGDDADVFSFVEKLYDFDYRTINFDGTERQAKASDVNSLVAHERVRVERVLGEFKASAPRGFAPKDDAALGAALKYDVAWRAVDGVMLEEGRFYSLPHLLEATRDLDSALSLAAQGFYKQSLQVLRGFVESSVMPLHFFLDSNALDGWKKGTYRTPPLRGGQGILKRLVAAKVIDGHLATQTGHIYGELNRSVHSAEADLEHPGIFRGEHPVPGFSEARLRRWVSAYREAVEAGIRLMAAGISAWSTNWPDALFCNSCHNGDADGFSINRLDFGDQACDHIRCKVCGQAQVRPLRLAKDLPPYEWEFPGIYFSRTTPLIP